MLGLGAAWPTWIQGSGAKSRGILHRAYICVYINNGTIWELNFLETILVYYVMDLQGFSMGFFMFTLPDTNNEFTPENGWLEDYLPFRMAYFRG